MNADPRLFQSLRQQAAVRLPPDFAQRVIREGERIRRQRSGRIRVIAVTGVLCAALAVAIHIVNRRTAERDNLEKWSSVAQQAQVLEASL